MNVGGDAAGGGGADAAAGGGGAMPSSGSNELANTQNQQSSDVLRDQLLLEAFNQSKEIREEHKASTQALLASIEASTDLTKEQTKLTKAQFHEVYGRLDDQEQRIGRIETGHAETRDIQAGIRNDVNEHSRRFGEQAQEINDLRSQNAVLSARLTKSSKKQKRIEVTLGLSPLSDASSTGAADRFSFGSNSGGAGKWRITCQHRHCTNSFI